MWLAYWLILFSTSCMANALGLNVNDRQLEILHAKYQGRDDLDTQELISDFILGCCPDITVEIAYAYLRKIQQVAEEEGIAYDCSSIPRVMTA